MWITVSFNLYRQGILKFRILMLPITKDTHVQRQNETLPRK